MASERPPSPADGIFSATSRGVLVSLLVTPRARATSIDGIADSADGPVLRIRISDSPENGKANAAVIKLLGRAWKIPQKDLSLVRGAKNRRKLLLVAGESSARLSDLQRWVKHHTGGH